MREHPRFAEQIPHDAVVILQLEGDEEVNRWARQLAESHRARETPLSVVENSGVSRGSTPPTAMTLRTPLDSRSKT